VVSLCYVVTSFVVFPLQSLFGIRQSLVGYSVNFTIQESDFGNHKELENIENLPDFRKGYYTNIKYIILYTNT